MKKNKMMRLASGLLVMTLMTTSVISGTFAKYTSTGSANDTARVAKWGVEITGSGNLFSSAYDNTCLPVLQQSSSELNVQFSDSTSATTVEELVAPGTKNTTGLHFGITGTPEVRTEITASEIEASDIYLAEGTYAEMRKVQVSEQDFAAKRDAKETAYDGLYTQNGNKFEKVTTTDVAKADEEKQQKQYLEDKGKDSPDDLTEGEEKDGYDAIAVPPAAYDPDTTYYELVNVTTVEEGGYYPVEYTYTYKDSEGKPKVDVDADNKKLYTKAIDIANMIAAKIMTGNTSFVAYDKNDSNKDKAYHAKYGSTSGITSTYAPNTNLANALNLDATITWKWDFVDSVIANIGETDKKDTILGDLIALGSESNVVKITEANNVISQIDAVTVTDNDATYNDGQNNVVVAHLETSFNINVTATQAQLTE